MALPRPFAYYDSVHPQVLRLLDFPYPTSFTASDGGGQVRPAAQLLVFQRGHSATWLVCVHQDL